MGVNVKNIINSRPGQISISIILGVGLASFFRKACNSRNCLVFQAPSPEEIDGKVYSYGNKCYSFKSSATQCDNSKKIIEYAYDVEE
tara:strand:- start:281 stop:541 length:261 start_codon:yes stop_codon:yes gene_type:complete